MQQTTRQSDQNHTRKPKPLSQRVVEAVAEEADVDDTDLPQLYDAIDPDALNSLFHSRPTGDDVDAMGAVFFTYNGYVVRVSAAGQVWLTGIGDG